MCTIPKNLLFKENYQLITVGLIESKNITSTEPLNEIRIQPFGLETVHEIENYEGNF